jgi:hypothetical protein
MREAVRDIRRALDAIQWPGRRMRLGASVNWIGFARPNCSSRLRIDVPIMFDKDPTIACLASFARYFWAKDERG